MDISQSHATNRNDDALFPGLRPIPELLPVYLLERLQPLFEMARLKYAQETSEGKTPNWCVLISRENCWTPCRVEWADYQWEELDGLGAPKAFECYGYTEGLDAYTVSVVGIRSGETSLYPALELFAFLNKDPALLGGYPEEIAHMATYSIIRLENILPAKSE